MLNKFFFNPTDNQDEGIEKWLDKSYDQNQQDFWKNSQNTNQNYTPLSQSRMPSSVPMDETKMCNK